MLVESPVFLPIKSDTVQSIAFNILRYDSPLKISQVRKYANLWYGKHVSFQAVRKVLLELTEQDVLQKKDALFSINPKWVESLKQNSDALYEQIVVGKKMVPSIASITNEPQVFIFETPNMMMQFWQEVIGVWYSNLSNGKDVLNCYQAKHQWEGLLYPAEEKNLMEKLKNKGVKSYQVIYGTTPLDKQISSLYNSFGVKTKTKKSTSSFDTTHSIGTYGDFIIEATYSKKLVERIESFFKSAKSVQQFRIHELAKLMDKKQKMKLTVMKNAQMAAHVNRSIMSHF